MSLNNNNSYNLRCLSLPLSNKENVKTQRFRRKCTYYFLNNNNNDDKQD